MAYIYKRGKSWAYRAYAGKDPVTGKDKQKSKSGFKTKKDAQLAAAIFERQFHNKEYIEPSKLLFSQVCADWENHYATQAKESSVRARRIALKHTIERFKDYPIQKITRKAYQDAIDQLASSFSENYVSSIHSSTHMVFEYAVELKLIKENPAKGAKLPKKKITLEELEKGEAVEDKYMEKDELAEFLIAAKEKGLEGDLLTFTMMAYTGLRIGELLALKWSEVDLQHNVIKVIRTYYNPNNNKLEYKLQTPKTKSSIRIVTFDSLVEDLLKQHLEDQERIKKENRPFYKDQGFIITTDEGYPRTIKHVSNRMERLLKFTTIKKHLTPHSFRHTHTSLLAQAGVSLPEIMERLGHEDEKTTKKIYLHVTKEMKEEASTKFSNLMKDLSNTIKI